MDKGQDSSTVVKNPPVSSRWTKIGLRNGQLPLCLPGPVAFFVVLRPVQNNIIIVVINNF